MRVSIILGAGLIAAQQTSYINPAVQWAADQPNPQGFYGTEPDLSFLDPRETVVFHHYNAFPSSLFGDNGPAPVPVAQTYFPPATTYAAPVAALPQPTSTYVAPLATVYTPPPAIYAVPATSSIIAPPTVGDYYGNSLTSAIEAIAPHYYPYQTPYSVTPFINNQPLPGSYPSPDYIVRSAYGAPGAAAYGPGAYPGAYPYTPFAPASYAPFGATYPTQVFGGY